MTKGPGQSTPPSATMQHVTCYSCDQSGHFAADYPNPQLRRRPWSSNNNRIGRGGKRTTYDVHIHHATPSTDHKRIDVTANRVGTAVRTSTQNRTTGTRKTGKCSRNGRHQGSIRFSPGHQLVYKTSDAPASNDQHQPSSTDLSWSCPTSTIAAFSSSIITVFTTACSWSGLRLSRRFRSAHLSRKILRRWTTSPPTQKSVDLTFSHPR